MASVIFFFFFFHMLIHTTVRLLPISHESFKGEKNHEFLRTRRTLRPFLSLFLSLVSLTIVVNGANAYEFESIIWNSTSHDIHSGMDHSILTERSRMIAQSE